MYTEDLQLRVHLLFDETLYEITSVMVPVVGTVPHCSDSYSLLPLAVSGVRCVPREGSGRHLAASQLLL